MARQDRDRDFTTDNDVNGTLYTSDRSDKSTRDYRDTRENRATAAETRNLMQDLAWFIPLALAAVAGYYLYQNYYATPVTPVATTNTATVDRAATPDRTATPAAAADRTATPATAV
ncbi:hypothetical protein H0X48_02075 [Candidatus Dependentiae bacterium]|nr:hypothetical protein [Candidatus Dependentiae bacterium]